jgi:protein transport protein SEC24
MMGAPPGGAAQPGVQPAAQQYPGYAGGGDFAAQAAALAEQMGSLEMGTPAPGQGGAAGVDMSTFPRPAGLSLPPAPQQPNAPPAFMRLTTNAVPNSASLLQRYGIPLGAIITPMSQHEQAPVAQFGESGIVRCRKCRTYINPFVQFSDGGRRFRCNVCQYVNEVPPDYYCPLDASGKRADLAQRPELTHGTVEYEASAEYMVRPPMPPSYMFALDVSQGAVQSGLLATAVNAIKGTLDSLPGDQRTQVGFITYDSTIHLYRLGAGKTQPQMMVLADLAEPFLPVPDDLLANLSESRAAIDSLLESLAEMHGKTASQDSCMGPALQTAFMVMQHCGGKLIIFQSAMPNLGEGKLRIREDPKLYGTDKEPTLRQPGSPFYKKLAAECSRVQVCVDLFLAPSAAPVDAFSLSSLAKYTCGSMYVYPRFHASRDGERLHNEIQRNLSRETGWEAVMRVRCSKGLRISAFHGNFFVRSSDLLALPCVSPDQSFAVQMSHEEGPLTGGVAYTQCALLFTTSRGERRIRVSTLATPIVADLGEMYRAADGDASAALLARLGAEQAMAARLDQARGFVQNRALQALREYRHLYPTQYRAPNKLMYPESLRLLALHALAATKGDALRGGGADVDPDARAEALFNSGCLPVEYLLQALYPTVYALHADEAAVDDQVLPPVAPACTEMIDGRGVYLMDTGRVLCLWVGSVAPAELVGELFGVDASQPVDPAALRLENGKGKAAQRAMAVVKALRGAKQHWQPFFVARQGDPSEAFFQSRLVEDRAMGAMSYTDFLCHAHRQVQSLG